jgi:hypothetical protein
MRRDHAVMRTLGVVFGLGVLALGVLALLGGAGVTDALVATRSRGLGATLLVVGVVAVVGSLTVADPHGIW